MGAVSSKSEISAYQIFGNLMDLYIEEDVGWLALERKA
jgi:hypothetical protein